MHGFCWGDAFNTQPKLCEGTAERDLGKGHMGGQRGRWQGVIGEAQGGTCQQQSA